MEEKKIHVSYIIKVGILSALAAVVQLIEFPLGIFPAFYQFDFSDVIALFGSFALDPWAGMLIELLKNLLHLILKPQMIPFIGEFANFSTGTFLVFIAGGIYHMNKTRKGALIGMISGAVSFVVAGGFLNYFLLIPAYIQFMGAEGVFSAAQEANAGIVDMKTMILFGTVPFNTIKAVVVSVVTFLLYKKVSPLLHDN